MGIQNAVTQKQSEYNQNLFSGGMVLFGDDTQIGPNQYRIGFDLTNRNGILDTVRASQKDSAAPVGLKQECVTFGNYIILFVAGAAYYRYYTSIGWTRIIGFKMSPTAPRYWTCQIPVATTNYYRLAITTTISGQAFPDATAGINTLQVAGASAGNLPGLLVQDNINQPQFIFLSGAGVPTVRTTQTFSQWSLTFTDAHNTTIAPNGDNREYVPIGNVMAWANGILFITSQDFSKIYRSVSGRPLDFVVNVTSALATTGTFTQTPGGDANTTAYSVGVGGITCIRPLATGGIFVSASGANFAVTLNTNATAPTEFGEYTFIRTFLFLAPCLSDRTVIDTLGDTRFISLTGIVSFNAVQQLQNEGRNSPFSYNIQNVFGSDTDPVIQDATVSAAILYDNYELYAVNTIFGFAIAKYDTIGQCWTSFDVQQTGGKAIKILAKIELSVQRLFAITEDDELYTLYIGPDETTAQFRTAGICSGILYANNNVRLSNPRTEVQLRDVRFIVNNIKKDTLVTFTPYVNNRQTKIGTLEKTLLYSTPTYPSDSSTALPDVDTELTNSIFTTPNCPQGWKVFGVFTWNEGSFTQFSMQLMDLTPMNPPNSQKSTV